MIKKLRVTVEGKTYDVVVELPDGGGYSQPAIPMASSAPLVQAPVSAPVASAPAPRPSGGGSGDVLSPLAGKVVAVDVQVGQSVTEGQQVLTLEAMKMNTYINAHVAGKVTEIFAKVGEGVDEGAVLLRIE